MYIFNKKLGSKFNKLAVNITIVTASVLAVNSSAQAAESVILKYGLLEDSINVSELSTFTKTGETSRKLDSYLKLSKQKPQNVREILTQKIPIDGVILSKMLNNPLGDLLLDSISEVITTPSEKASRESLRGALVTSAIEDNNLSLIEIIENYPTQEIHVKGDRLLEIYQQMESILGTISVLKF